MLHLFPEPGREQRWVDDGLGLEDVERRARDLPLGQRRLAAGGTVITCPSPLNIIKATYDHSCY